MGGSCFEQVGPLPDKAKDRELKELDNFYCAPFVLNGKQWPTTEHYFQAQKFPNSPDLQEEIRTAATCMGPGGCYMLGQSRGRLRPDWEEVKVDIMYSANKAKFQQNPSLAALLRGTKGRIRAQGNADGWATWNEILLERVREELRSEHDCDATVLSARVSTMNAYRTTMQQYNSQPNELRNQRLSLAIARLAEKRQDPSIVVKNSQMEGFTVKGFEDTKGEAPWISGVFWVDPLEPVVNGQPHLITGTVEDGEHGHMFYGSRNGLSQWVLDESFDPNQTGGYLTLPPASAPKRPSHGVASMLPLGKHQWIDYGGAATTLDIVLGRGRADAR